MASVPKKPRRKRTWANPEWAAAMREIGRSSATQRHTLKARKGSRADRRKHAITDQRTEQDK